MAEDFTTAELVVPGTYIRVRADALQARTVPAAALLAAR